MLTATLAVLAVLGLAACGDSPSATPRPAGSSPAAPTVPQNGTTTPAATPDPCAVAPVKVGGPPGESTYVTDAHFPTAIAWAPDGRLFFAERAGAVRVATRDDVTTITTIPTVTTEANGGGSERGLLGLALSPHFETDHLVYVFASNPDRTTQSVQRFRECHGSVSDMETLLTLPAGDDCCHKGGRIAFGPDGKLYVTLGDEHSVRASTVASTSSIPQDVDDVRGKVLRYDADGSVPADNPFGPGNPVWAAGFRNVFGIAFGGGRTFVTANGPTGDLGWGSGMDLAMFVTAGSRGQWPACAGYSHLTTGATDCLGRPEPDWSSEDETLVPTGAAWIDGRGPEPYAGHFVFCTYVDGMRVFTPGAPHASVSTGPAACRLDVAQGPDDAVYYSDETSIRRFARTD